MSRDDIIRMAREANILEPVDLLESNQWRQDTIRELERFAGLIVAHTKEQCAELMDEMAARDKMTNYYKVAARAIREMNE